MTAREPTLVANFDCDDSAYLSSFFLDPSRHVQIGGFVLRNRGASDFRTEEFWSSPTPVHYRDKKLYILVGPETFSAGEAFAHDLQALKRATIVGARTKGGAGGNPNGLTSIGANILVFVPSERAENPVTKSNWEGAGVTPDVAVGSDDPLDVAMRLALAGRQPIQADRGGARAGSAQDYWLDAPLLKIRTSPLSGSEDAVRRLIGEVIAAHPSYESMSPEIAKTVREKLPHLRAMLTALGTVRSVSFQRVDAMGDVYGVDHERGRSQWTIFVRNGRIEGLIFPAG
jgi:hypothetical protein